MSWEALLNKNRKVKEGGEKYNYLFRAAKHQRNKVLSGMNPENTVAYLQQMVVETAYQTKALADFLRKDNTNDSCKAIWTFIFDNILYKTEDEEELTEPNFLWAVRKGRGGDCDDFALFAATLLYNLQIPFAFRITKYAWNPTRFQHIYIVAQGATTQGKEGRTYIIDPVLNQYNTEIPFLAKQDFPMNTYRLSGFGEIAAVDTGAVEDAKAVLMTLKSLALSSPERLLREYGYTANEFIPLADKALSVWEDEVQRNQALDDLESNETEHNDLHGFNGLGLACL